MKTEATTTSTTSTTETTETTESTQTATTGAAETAEPSQPMDDVETLDDEPTILAGKDQGAKASGESKIEIDADEARQALERHRLEQQKGVQTLRDSTPASGTTTTVLAGDKEPKKPTAPKGDEPGLTGAGVSNELADGVGIGATVVEVITLSPVAGFVGVGAAAVSNVTSLGAAHADAHQVNERNGRIDGYAAGYASGLHGEPSGSRTLKKAPGVGSKAQTYARSFNENAERGYDDAMALTDEQRAARLTQYEHQMRAYGEGHLVGDPLVTGRYVKYDLQR